MSHAADSLGDGIGRRWGDSLGDQQLHTHAVQHKENIERGSGHCRYYLAFERLWNHREPLDNQDWEVKTGGRGGWDEGLGLRFFL
jgi:hypothetical protein